MAPSTLPRTNLGKGLHALAHGLRRPAELVRKVQRGLVGMYRESVLAESRIPEVALQRIIVGATVTELQNCWSREGNVSLQELFAIAAFVRQREPRVLVEIGTFDGNTALQMARNSPGDATVFTLDLPAEGAIVQGPIETQDSAYIKDRQKLQRKFASSEVAGKVVQWLGDSMTFDFEKALQGRLVDFAFIDGSHSYEYVASDTAKMLKLIAPAGMVFWHDYAPAWPGVMRFLDELADLLPLRRIEGTALVLYDSLLKR